MECDLYRVGLLLTWLSDELQNGAQRADIIKSELSGLEIQKRSTEAPLEPQIVTTHDSDLFPPLYSSTGKVGVVRFAIQNTLFQKVKFAISKH